jgi:hypothetical protein
MSLLIFNLNMRKYISLLVFLPTLVYSQGWIPTGARSGGLLNASTTLTDNWSYFNNPGALGKLETIGAGVTYESRYLLADLQRQSLAVAIPTKLGVFSVGAFNQGSAEYRNFRSGVGYALKLAEHFSAGVQINYQGLRLPDYYGKSNTVTAEFGVLLNVTEKWDFGFAVFNLGQNKLSEFKNDRYNTTLRLGTAYNPSKQVKVISEVWKDVDGPISFKGALEYEPFKQFHFRLGAGNKPTALAFGFGYKWKEFSLDIATAYHQVLGWSPQISFTYETRKGK